MQGERYIVKKNDNLWRIAHETLGHGREWPRIWKYNNRPEVVRTTGRPIPNPDLIYVGQVLLIPRLVGDPTSRPSAAIVEKRNLPVARELGKASPPPTPDLSSPQRYRHTPDTPETLSDQATRLRVPVAFKYELGQLH